MTLYRPRDLLVLLNGAFLRAFQHNRTSIVGEDIDASAEDISSARYSDLIKEYEAVFPGLQRLTRAFADGPGERSPLDAQETVLSALRSADLGPEESQHFAVLGNTETILTALYGVGFVGVRDSESGRFKFCHDGSQERTPTPGSAFLVHPCYWRALNVRSQELPLEEAVEIHDEYDIEVSSTTPELRKHQIGKIMAECETIPLGIEGAAAFEHWCHIVISILFAAGLRNIELKPNKNATQRRDVVARNQESTDTWKRVLKDYGSRQVVFEVKNFMEIGPTEYRQMNSYLCRDYGTLGFIITRDSDEAVRKDKELPWVREIYFEHKKMIVKLTAKWCLKYLSKARSPQKHDAADRALGGLLDRYSRMYLSIGHRG